MKTALVTDKRYYLLWIAQFISTVGDWAYYFVIALFMYSISGKNISLGILTLTYTLPGILLAPLAGMLSDKFNRKTILIISDLCRVIIISVFPFTRNLLLIYFLVFIEQSFTVLFTPAIQAIIPELITEKKQLLNANSWISGGKSIARVLGSALGGMLYALVGMDVIFWADGITYLIAALLVALIKYTPSRSGTTDKTASLPKIFNLDELKQGFQLSHRNRPIRYLLYNYAAIMFLTSLVGTFLVTYCDVVLNTEGEIFGMLMSVQSVGAIAGSFLIPILLHGLKTKGMVRLSLSSLFFFSLVPVLIILIPVLPVVGLLLLFFGAVELSLGAIFQTIVQSKLSNEFQGRVFSLQGAIFSFSYLAGAMGGGVLIDQFNLQNIFIASGAVFIPVCLFLLLGYEKNKNIPSRRAGQVDMTETEG